jgi:HEAT repeat protein
MRISIFSAALAILLAPVALLAQDTKEKAKLETKRSFQPINGKTMIEWMNDLKSKDPSVVEYAVANLKVFQQEARDASREIIKFAKARDTSLKVNAIISLGWIGFYDNDLQEGVNVLTQALHDNQEIVRYQAAVALRGLGPKAYPATGALISTLRNSNSWEVRRAAAATLGLVAKENPLDKGFDRGAFAALVDTLGMNNGQGDSAQEVRMEAIISLIRLGLPGQPADRNKEKQALYTMATSSRQPPKVSIWAHAALWMLDKPTGQNSPYKAGQQHLAAIAKFLKSTDLQSREHAVRALGVIGPDAASRVPDLIDILEDKNPGIVGLTCVALSNMGDAAREALPVLEKMSQRHPDDGVREAARLAVEKIKEKHKVVEASGKQR